MTIAADTQTMPQSILAQLAAQYGGTQSVPAIQRSQYLADALQSMSKAGDNIRTPGALGANLLAEAVLRWGQNKANSDLLKQIGTGQSSMAADAVSGALGPGDVPATDTVQQPPVAPPTAAPPGSATPAPQTTAPANDKAVQLGKLLSMSPEDRLNLDRTVWGEARGEPLTGQQAVAQVILNRGRQSGKSASEIVSAPHQFQGYNDRSRSLGLDNPQIAKIDAAIQPVIDGTAQLPAGVANATNFYNPAIAHPSWGNSDGTVIGGHKFMSLSPVPGMAAQGAQQVAQAGPGPQPMPSAPPQGMLPAPTQLAMNGPAPPGVGGPPVSAPPMPMVPQQQQAAQQPQGPPTGQYATPQEAAYIKERLSHPPGSLMWQQGLQKAQEVQQRAMTPLGPPKDMVWSQAAHQFVPEAGVGSHVVSEGPNGGIQADQFGARSTFGNPNVGALGPNQISNPDGSVSNRTVQQTPTFKIPGANGIFTNGPDGRPVKVAEDSFTPKDLGERLTKLQGSDQFKLADTATNMYNAAVQAATRPGGISDVELRDFAARQFSGGVARQFNVEALNHAQGAWATVKQYIPELISGQKMSPAARQAVLTAMHDDAIQAKNAFGGLAQSDEAFANAQGMSLAPYLPPLSRPLADMPQLDAIPSGNQFPGGVQSPGGNNPSPGSGGGAGPNPAPAPSPLQAAALAEARKRGLVK